MAVVIRRATRSDAPVIREIQMLSFGEYQSFLGLSAPPAAMRETLEAIEAATETQAVFIAVYNQMKVIGAIRARLLTQGVGYIGRFATLPSWQKAGAGSQLMAAALEWCADHGCRAVTLHTAVKQIPLARFYHGQGFYVHSVRDTGDYRRGLFVKELADCADVDFEAVCGGL